MNGKIGILVHGRHLQAKNWADLEWGIPPTKMGVLPTMARLILKIGIEKIGLIVFGTGASEKDGLKEAEYTKRYFLNKLIYLLEFDFFINHPEWNYIALSDYFLNMIRPEIQSQNTLEEIRNAARLFAEANIKYVLQISCGSHISRCIRDRLIVGVPKDQEWFAVADDMFFADSTAKDVVIIEAPHRGDDPMINAPIKPHQIVPRLFKIPAPERMKFLAELDTFLKNYRA